MSNNRKNAKPNLYKATVRFFDNERLMTFKNVTVKKIEWLLSFRDLTKPKGKQGWKGQVMFLDLYEQKGAKHRVARWKAEVEDEAKGNWTQYV
jgi:hypothetical protein